MSVYIVSLYYVNSCGILKNYSFRFLFYQPTFQELLEVSLGQNTKGISRGCWSRFLQITRQVPFCLPAASDSKCNKC